MPAIPPILIRDEKHGLPYSKGLMAQSFTATGLSPARAYLAAQKLQDEMIERGVRALTIRELQELAVDVLARQAGEEYAERYLKLRELSKLERPLVILIGGTTGVGKSTIATEIAHRLGITRIVSTDSIREVMRGIFAKELMPAIYESSFNAWRGLRVPVPHGANPVIVGFREQTSVVITGIRSLIERAVLEGESLVVEGVHVVPGYIEPSQFKNASVVQLLVTVDDEEAHRSHFYIREVQTDGTRPFEKYRANFGSIRLLGRYIEDLAAEHGTPIVHSHQLDKTVAEVLELVVNAAIRDDEKIMHERSTSAGQGA
ncbi:MAG: ATP cone domain-containing protein [Coriobacteriales bacterium]|nr:2-phosphoglycerate kinase [Actinomycetes bacterium]